MEIVYMAKRERVVKHEHEDVSSIILRADSCKLTMQHKYDFVLTSPPWPGYDNASNGVSKLSHQYWQEICAAIAGFCANAQSDTGVKGLIELPGDLDDASRQAFISTIQQTDLQILRKGTDNIACYISGHKGTPIKREWWIILDRVLTNEQLKELAIIIPQIEDDLNTLTRPAYRDSSMEAWKQAAFKAARESRIQIPPRLARKHLYTLFSHLFSEGNTVFDPFAGTGETLKVAMEFNINSIGVDVSRSHVAGIEGRMKFASSDQKTSVRFTRGSSKTRSTMQLAVDTNKTIKLYSPEEQDKHGLIDRIAFLQKYGVDPNFNKRVQAQYVSHEYSKYTGKKPAYLYRHPKQGELSESLS